MSLRIIKKASGNVQLLGAGRNEFYPASQHFRIASDGNTIEIMDRGIVASSFSFSDIVATQVEPSAEIAPPALVGDFLTLLDGSFFFDVSGGGGIISGALTLESVGTATLSSTPVHDLAITGDINAVSRLEFNVTTASNLTGIIAPTSSNLYVLKNTGTSLLAIAQENVNSDPVNRFSFSTTIAAGNSISILYNTNTSRFDRVR